MVAAQRSRPALLQNGVELGTEQDGQAEGGQDGAAEGGDGAGGEGEDEAPDLPSEEPFPAEQVVVFNPTDERAEVDVSVVPVGDEPIGDVNRSRLWLNDATGQVLRTALGHLGVSAPERM